MPTGCVLEDLSGIYTPKQWAQKAINAMRAHGAYTIIAESNNGGEMVSNTIHTLDSSVPVKLVWASASKQARAEPISSIYEQGRITHLLHPHPDSGAMVGFAALEDEYCSWEPGTGMPSPNRLDAAVWAFTELAIDPAYVGTQKVSGV